MDSRVGHPISSFIANLSSVDRCFLLQLQEKFVSSNTPDITAGVRSFSAEDVVRVERLGTEDDYFEGLIYFASGEMFQGVFNENFSYCEGKLFPSVKSERGCEGTWTDGQLNGLATTDNDYGGLLQCFFIDGVKHGVSVEFGPDRRKHFMKLCWYDSGTPCGTAIRGLMGGVLIFGKVSSNSKISDKRAAVLMPDMKGSFEAIVCDDVFVRGQQTEVVDICLQGLVPVPRLSRPVSGTVYRRDVSTGQTISNSPLLTDPWEWGRVEARPSGLPGAGEGLFARRRLERGDLVALYNGTRSVPSLYEDWSDYRVNLTTACDIDIPGPAQDTNNYCATLAHKANHSFSPNCRWSRIDHPRFGLICSLTAVRRIEEGEEVTVNYGLPLHLAPDWYKLCARPL